MASTVAERLRAYLSDHAGEADIEAAYRHAFSGEASPVLARRLLEAALPRELQFNGDKVAWLQPKGPGDDLATARFIIVDLETTGTRAESDAILEFGAVFVEGERVVGEEQTLLRPNRLIPPFIRSLTGIDDEMVADAPAFADVAERLHALFRGAVPVAHNASFDFGFLDRAFVRYGLPPVGADKLCTLKLARALAPARRNNLDALAERLGVTADNRHRALGDARTTAHVLIELLRIARQAGVESVSALRKVRTASRGRGVEARLHVGEERVRSIPQRPGVYRFRDKEGGVIYVGKALNLRNRLGSYFVGAPKGKVSRMLGEVRDFDYTVVGSELEALLEEAREIRLRQPKYNRAMRTLGRYGYLRHERGEPFPVLRFAREPGEPGRYRSFGPFRFPAGGRFEVKALRETFALRNCRGKVRASEATSPCMEHALGRCGAPCAALQDAAGYARELERLGAFLTGDGEALVELRRSIEAAAKAERFERAAALRDRYRILAAIRHSVRRESAGAALGDRLIVLPAAEDGNVRLYYMRPGSALTTTRASAHQADWLPVIKRLLAAPAQPPMEALEDTRIAEAWLRRKPSACALKVADFVDEADLAGALAAAVRGDELQAERARSMDGRQGMLPY